MKPLLSACLIVKDETHSLERCLSSIRPVVDEIIVLQTNHNPAVKEIARAYADQLDSFQWCDHFSVARNQAIKKAHGQWILSIDADEWLDPLSAQDLRSFVHTLDPELYLAYSFLSYTGQQDPHYKRALWANGKGFYFDGRVHEQLCYQSQFIRLQHLPDFVLHHEVLKRPDLQGKAAYYLQLLKFDLAECTQIDKLTHLWRHLADTYLELQLIPEAIAAYLRAIDAYEQAGMNREDSLYSYLLIKYLDHAREPEAMIEKALILTNLSPQTPSAWWALAWCYFELNQPAEAFKALRQLDYLDYHDQSLWQQELLAARCLSALGHQHQADYILRDVLKRFPEPASLYYHLARVACLLGHITEARDILAYWHRFDSDLDCLEFLCDYAGWSRMERAHLIRFKLTMASENEA